MQTYLGLVQAAMLFAQNTLSQVRSLGSLCTPICRSRVARNTAFRGVKVRFGVLHKY